MIPSPFYDETKPKLVSEPSIAIEKIDRPVKSELFEQWYDKLHSIMHEVENPSTVYDRLEDLASEIYSHLSG